ncbi:hypothetical protein F5Y13DRAFT_185733 [Hypoxylon sp. FL1857]|nr:hypothetical protein F5Y13DRAFT_185733 [Hypoxylon sp. FL1857]
MVVLYWRGAVRPSSRPLASLSAVTTVATWTRPETARDPSVGAAELASGNSCVCFPELAVLLRKNRKRSTPHRPTTSEIQSWNESKPGRKPPSDPYFTNSLMSTMFSTNGDGQYIELHV